MPEFMQIVSALKEQMSASLSRSDALRPLAWVLGTLVVALLGTVYGKADTWVLVAIFALTAVTLAVYLGAYAFFALKDPDALRSERYSLNKMAIEHGLRGDSTTGWQEEAGALPVRDTRAIDFQGGEDA